MEESVIMEFLGMPVADVPPSEAVFGGTTVTGYVNFPSRSTPLTDDEFKAVEL